MLCEVLNRNNSDPKVVPHRNSYDGSSNEYIIPSGNLWFVEIGLRGMLHTLTDTQTDRLIK